MRIWTATLLAVLLACAGCFGSPPSSRPAADEGDADDGTATKGPETPAAGKADPAKGTAKTVATTGKTLAAPLISIDQQGNVVRFSFIWGAAATEASWEFGDGAASNESAPQHTYQATGRFQVTLRTLSAAGLGQASAEVNVTDVPFKPHVNRRRGRLRLQRVPRSVPAAAADGPSLHLHPRFSV